MKIIDLDLEGQCCNRNCMRLYGVFPSDSWAFLYGVSLTPRILWTLTTLFALKCIIKSLCKYGSVLCLGLHVNLHVALPWI